MNFYVELCPKHFKILSELSQCPLPLNIDTLHIMPNHDDDSECESDTNSSYNKADPSGCKKDSNDYQDNEDKRTMRRMRTTKPMRTKKFPKPLKLSFKESVQIFENKYKDAQIMYCDSNVKSKDSYLNQFVRSVCGSGWKFSRCSGINESTKYFEKDPYKMAKLNSFSFKVLEIRLNKLFDYFMEEDGKITYDFVMENGVEELEVD